MNYEIKPEVRMSTFHSLEEARLFFVKDRFATENNMTLEALTEGGAVCAM